ncbi:MAG: tetratricopeptide repeat protein [Candidatus Limnocylindria bacterium]
MVAERSHPVAQAALEGGDHETVLRVTDELLAIHPGDDAAHALRARSLMALGRLEEAERHAADAVRLDPDEIGYRELLAEVRSRGGAHADAAFEYARLAAGDPRQTDWTVGEARERVSAAEPSAGAQAARRALRLDPDNAEAQLSLARALVAQRDRSGAVDAARRAAQLLPGDVRARETLADAQTLAGQHRAAFEGYRALVGQLHDADRRRVLDAAAAIYRRRGGRLARLIAAWPGLFAFALQRGWASVR